MKHLIFSLIALLIMCGTLPAQDTNEQDKIMITIFLKHDQDMNFTEIQQRLQENGFWKIFPPDDVEVISWYVIMGVGQVVTVKLAPAKLRELNLTIENGAWGAFNTDFYATYDYMPVWKEMKEKYK